MLPVAPQTFHVDDLSFSFILAARCAAGGQAWWAGGSVCRIERVVGSGCAQHDSNTTLLDRPVGRSGGLCARHGLAQRLAGTSPLALHVPQNETCFYIVFYSVCTLRLRIMCCICSYQKSDGYGKREKSRSVNSVKMRRAH